MNKLAPCIAEAIGTFTLFFIGVGAINAAHGNSLAIAFAHGLAIAVMVSATGHISGGHLNPAVTFGALPGGKIEMTNAMRYRASHLIGATVAGFVCLALFGRLAVACPTRKRMCRSKYPNGPASWNSNDRRSGKKSASAPARSSSRSKAARISSVSDATTVGPSAPTTRCPRSADWQRSSANSPGTHCRTSSRLGSLPGDLRAVFQACRHLRG
jgi:Major intrinsic protein